MTDDVANHTLEMLRQLRNQNADMLAEMRMNQRIIDAQLQMIRQQMGSFFGFQRLQDESIQHLRERVERLERHADLLPGEDA